MRLITSLLILLLPLGLSSLSAQNCCAGKKKACKSYSSLQTENTEAFVAAEADDKISIVADEETGAKKFIMKLECAATGGVKYQEVLYSASSGTFVCDPTKCDPADCVPSKCDLSKCDPQKCDFSMCLGTSKGALTAKETQKKKTTVGS